jgi:hypothetical protein
MLAAAMVTFASSAPAQEAPKAYPETTAQRMGRFSVRPQDVEHLAEILALTPEQIASVRGLREGEAAALDVYEKRRAKCEQAVADAERGSEDRRRKSDVRFEALCELWNERWSGGEQFRKDLQALLTPEQSERWPMALRLLRRDIMVGMTGGSMTRWCTVDLVELIRGAGLTKQERDGLRQLMEQYELEVDRLLSVREERQRASYPISVDNFLNPKPDRTEEEFYDDNSLALARLNQQHARRLSAALGPDKGPALAKAAKQAAYYYVYNSFTRPGPDLMGRAVRLEDLTPEQREKLAAVDSDYARSSERLHEELIAVLDMAEDEYLKFRNLPQQEQQRRYQTGDHPGGRAWREAEVERGELEQRTLERINQVLTAGQRKVLEAVEKVPPSP